MAQARQKGPRSFPAPQANYFPGTRPAKIFAQVCRTAGMETKSIPIAKYLPDQCSVKPIVIILAVQIQITVLAEFL